MSAPLAYRYPTGAFTLQIPKRMYMLPFLKELLQDLVASLFPPPTPALQPVRQRAASSGGAGRPRPPKH